MAVGSLAIFSNGRLGKTEVLQEIDRLYILNCTTAQTWLCSIHSAGGKPEVLFCLNESLMDPADGTPSTHKFIMSTGFTQHLTVLGQTGTVLT